LARGSDGAEALPTGARPRPRPGLKRTHAHASARRTQRSEDTPRERERCVARRRRRRGIAAISRFSPRPRRRSRTPRRVARAPSSSPRSARASRARARDQPRRARRRRERPWRPFARVSGEQFEPLTASSSSSSLALTAHFPHPRVVSAVCPAIRAHGVASAGSGRVRILTPWRTRRRRTSRR